jgi:homoserine O-acetyltransferase
LPRSIRDRQGGWWESLVGPGKVLDPARYFIICINVLGHCMGTTGPRRRTPPASRGTCASGGDHRRHGARQAALLDHLGIPDLFCVIGGSMGGMQVLEWAASYPDARLLRRADRLRRAPFGAEHRLPRGRPAGDHGRSRMEGRRLSPAATRAGAWPAVARMTAHITYLSEQALQRKFGRSLQNAMRWASASTPTSRSRATCATRARPSSTASTPTATSTSPAPWTISTSPRAHGGVLANAFKGSPTRFCLISFTSDWLFPTRESREIVHALNAAAANVSFVEVESDKGHDAFLLDEPEMFRTLAGFLKGARPHGGWHERDCPDPRRPAADRRHGRAGWPRARRRLRRRRAAGLPDRLQAGRCARHGAQPGRRPTPASPTACRSSRATPTPDLRAYPDAAFDYVILSQTLQATREPREVLQQMLRVGKRAIVSFPTSRTGTSACAWCSAAACRETPSLPYKWYDTPNIHLCSIDDFRALCRDMGVRIERAIVLNRNSRPIHMPPCSPTCSASRRCSCCEGIDTDRVRSQAGRSYRLDLVSLSFTKPWRR